VNGELVAELGSRIVKAHPLAGGDINDAYAIELANGERWFVKTRADAPLNMYAREAEGLSWLAEAGVLRTPKVRLVRPDCLVLELMTPASRSARFEEQLGRGLATLHAFGAPSFGLDVDNFIAVLPQRNAKADTFAEFYRAQRLSPLARSAADRGLLSARDLASFDALYARLGALIPEEPPSRLHGDLWSGNVHVDEAGAPVLIDPAVYGGHREVDLAMLRLFGAPNARFFAAYDEVSPRAPGHEERVALFQLYPLLVHVNLFGASYVPQLRSALKRYA